MNSDITAATVASILGPERPVGTPEVRMIFVSSINGEAAVAGTSGALGNATDFEVLLGARAWADVVMVGAGTVRAENYGGVRLDEATQRARRARGQAPVPPLAVVGRTLDFTPDSRVVADYHVPPLFLRLPGGPEPAPALASESIIELHSFTAGECLARLREAGFARILCEGGPTLYSKLMEEDCVDVVHWTLDPSFVYPQRVPVFPRAAHVGDAAPLRHRFGLRSATPCEDGVLFLRYDRLR